MFWDSPVTARVTKMSCDTLLTGVLGLRDYIQDSSRTVIVTMMSKFQDCQRYYEVPVILIQGLWWG